MKKTGKMMSVALAAMLICSLAACGKNDSDKLVISVANVGNGYTFVEEIAKEFTKETGIKCDVRPTAVQTHISTTLPSGPKNNEIDVYFANDQYFSVLRQGKNYVKGFDYEKAILDVSDVYEMSVSGWTDKEGNELDLKVKDVIPEATIEAMTYDIDEKQYFMPYVSNMEGIIYNKGVFNAKGYKIPVTTNQLIDLCAQIKADYGEEKYAFVYCGLNGYSRYITNIWWGQYEGKENYENFWKGIYDGSYEDGWKNFSQVGRKYAINTLDTLWNHENGYADPTSISKTFTQGQLAFLEGDGLMTVSGDWIEREMDGNFEPGEVDIALMQTPVISAFSEKLSYWKETAAYDALTDETKKDAYDNALATIIEYIDSLTTATPKEKPTSVDGLVITDADIAAVKKARTTKTSDSATAFITAYSNKIDEAKQFLAYFYNKESQNIMLKETNGATAPLVPQYNLEYFSNFSALSPMQKEKISQLKYDSYVQLFNCRNHAMSYAAGLVNEWYTGSGAKVGALIGMEKKYEGYKSGMTIFTETVDHYKAEWSNMLKNAGLE